MIKLFGYFISKSFLLLALLEILTFASSIWFADYYRQYLSGQDNIGGIPDLRQHVILYTSIMLAAMFALGLYQRGVLERASGFVIRLVIAFFIGGILVGLISYISGLHSFKLLELILALLFSFALVLIQRSVFVRVTTADSRKRRVLVLGTGINADRIEMLQADDPSLGFVVVGYVDLGDSVSLIDDFRQIEKEFRYS